MDTRSFYLLLSSLAASALSACGEDDPHECPSTKVLAEEDREIPIEGLCEAMARLPGRMSGAHGVVGQQCGELCEDQSMNVCLVHADYAREFSELNRVDAGARTCPVWEKPTIPITCTHEEYRGEWREGCGVAGRRPGGLLTTRRREHDTIADFLARAAHLEAASVFAFEKLAEDLARLGAPAALIDACLRAARDETRHAEVMGRLARARGARPWGVDVLARGNASPLELALENIVEGVVREAYGALQASVSAQKARDPEVRAAMASVAEDEAAHAWLALRIADWLDAGLSPLEHAQVAEAKRQAMVALRSELELEPAQALKEQLGLPSRAEALRLFAQLERAVWSDRLAA